MGRSFIIECPYKLLVSKHMIYEVGLLELHDFKNFVINFSISLTNHRNTTSYRAFNELILFNARD